MNPDEMAGCFGAERRSYQRWERAEGELPLHQAQGAHGAVDVLLRHYEVGGDTPHSMMMKWVQTIRTGCKEFGPFEGEIDWAWEFTQSTRSTPHETLVTLPGIALPMHWGVRWPSDRHTHLKRLLRSTTDPGEQDKLIALIDHYDAILFRYEQAAGHQGRAKGD